MNLFALLLLDIEVWMNFIVIKVRSYSYRQLYLMHMFDNICSSYFVYYFQLRALSSTYIWRKITKNWCNISISLFVKSSNLLSSNSALNKARCRRPRLKSVVTEVPHLGSSGKQVRYHFYLIVCLYVLRYTNTWKNSTRYFSNTAIVW